MSGRHSCPPAICSSLELPSLDLEDILAEKIVDSKLCAESCCDYVRVTGIISVGARLMWNSKGAQVTPCTAKIATPASLLSSQECPNGTSNYAVAHNRLRKIVSQESPPDEVKLPSETVWYLLAGFLGYKICGSFERQRSDMFGIFLTKYLWTDEIIAVFANHILESSENYRAGAIWHTTRKAPVLKCVFGRWPGEPMGEFPTIVAAIKKHVEGFDKILKGSGAISLDLEEWQ